MAKKRLNKEESTELTALKKLLKSSLKKQSSLQSEISERINNKIKEKENRDYLLEVEKEYKKSKSTDLLKHNTQYQHIKRILKNSTGTNYERTIDTKKIELEKITLKIGQLRKEIEIKQIKKPKNKVTHIADEKQAKRNKVPNGIKNIKKEFIPTSLITNTNKKLTKSFEAEWENITFNDGFIIIEHEKHFYRRDINQSKKYLNEIKSYYNYHNIPKLRVITKGMIVVEIENQDVLFYHIDFMSIAGSNFGLIKLDPFKQSEYSKYTKEFYKKNLDFVFHTESLKFLCEHSDPILPIIPVGEVVIYINGLKEIHNSFLFPVKSKSGVSLIWESTKEKKATYVFEISIFSNEEVQILFDYIAGDIKNKRDTLINSSSLKRQLKMAKRIRHINLSNWENEILFVTR